MPMPVKFTTAEFVAAAVRLVVSGGPAAATAAAVAAAVGAPSGSVYHRFPRRADLLAAAWIATLRDFHAAFLPLLDTADDPVAVGVAAAREVVAWSVANPESAALLARYGRSDFVGGDCSAPVRAEADALDHRLAAALAGLLDRFPAVEGDRVRLAVVDAPLALVRRSLAAGGPNAATMALAGDAAQRLLAGPRPPDAEVREPTIA
ncbi:TetR family transcriptional regulator [Mycolicibacillus parakoreensis]|nr:TetR family transcriptional regulator [Mycolicibacillus parakoreensis]